MLLEVQEVKLNIKDFQLHHYFEHFGQLIKSLYGSKIVIRKNKKLNPSLNFQV
jgi:hypothetical protein